MARAVSSKRRGLSQRWGPVTSSQSPSKSGDRQSDRDIARESIRRRHVHAAVPIEIGQGHGLGALAYGVAHRILESSVADAAKQPNVASILRRVDDERIEHAVVIGVAELDGERIVPDDVSRGRSERSRRFAPRTPIGQY